MLAYCGAIPIPHDFYRIEVCLPGNELIYQLYYVRVCPVEHVYFLGGHGRDRDYRHLSSAVFGGVSVVVEAPWQRNRDRYMGGSICHLVVHQVFTVHWICICCGIFWILISDMRRPQRNWRRNRMDGKLVVCEEDLWGYQVGLGA